MAQYGYFIISDITGYTEYLSGSELDHAQDSLSKLLQLLVDHVQPPQILNRLEGDAVVSYIPANLMKIGQTLVDAIEGTYYDFRRARHLMEMNTTCRCAACRNIPNLDLKFFVHYGEYSIQKMAGREELIGKDVITVFRLTKNRVTEITNLKAYALYSQAAIEALDLESLAKSFFHYTESYEHIGAIPVCIQNLPEQWEKVRELDQVRVNPEDSIITIEHDFDIPMPILWEYMVNPAFRAIMQGSISQNIIPSEKGRFERGAVFECVHDDKTTIQTILDWRPFEYYSTRETLPYFNTFVYGTYQLKPMPDGKTRLSLLTSRAFGNKWAEWFMNLVMKNVIANQMYNQIKIYIESIQSDWATKRIEQGPMQLDVHQAALKMLTRTSE